MNKCKPSMILGVAGLLRRAVLTCCLLTVPAAWGATCTSQATGNWATAATWTGCGGTTPGSADTAIIANGHTVTINSTITAGAITINSGGTLGINLANNESITVNGATAISGTLTYVGNRGTKTFNGLVTVNSGGTWNDSVSADVTFNGGLANNGTLTVTQGTYTFGASQTLSGSSAMTIPVMSVSSGATLTNTGTLTVTGSLSGAGTLSNGNAGILNIEPVSGFTLTTLSAAGTNNTVNYSLAGAQTVRAISYVNLGVSGGGAKTLAGNTTVNGTLTLSTATLTVGASTLTLNGPTIAGTPGNLTTSASSSLEFGGSSSGVMVPSSVAALTNLTVNNTNGIALSAGLAVSGTLTQTSGNIGTGSYTLTLSANCPSSHNRSSGFVVGNLSLKFPTGTTTCTYHVGDSTGYAPMTLAMSSVTTSGAVVGRADSGDHPDTTAGYSGIDPAKSANHYWTLSAGSPTLVYTSYAATFQFCANTGACTSPSEVDTGANTSNFIVARKASSVWTLPTVGTKNSYSTQATGLSAFGEFAVGEASISAASLHHVRLEHSGSACTARPASITVKACGDAACASVYTSSTTVNLDAITNGTWSSDPVTFSGGAAVVTLTVTTAGSVTLGATATSPTTANPTRCFNGATETCTVSVGTCYMDMVEVGAAAGTAIFTKLSNAAFSLDAKRTGANQTLTKVELVDASSGTCSTFTALQDYSTALGLPETFNGSKQTSTYGFTYNEVVANARFRLTSSSGVSCSTDNFAIRPQAFTVTSSASNAGSSGTPVFRAGTDVFTVTATAVYGTTTTTGYTGTPKFDGTLVTTTLANLGAVTGTTFPAASAGVSGGTTFKYDEVGNFSLSANAVYDDTFAAVDSTKGECTSGFSNTLSGGKYSCKFGSVSAGPFGRFVPDHFTVQGTIANTCTAGSYTYMGQSFVLTPVGVVEARNAANGVTANYAGVYAPGTVTFGAENADSGTDLKDSLVFAGSGLALSGSWVAGKFTLTDSVTAIRFTRPTTTAGPYDALDIGLTVTDTDVSTVPRVEGADMNPAVVGGTTFTYKKISGSPLRMRYGRLRMLNAYGSERLPLPMVWETQYWSGQSFIRHMQDSCTTLAAANIALSNYQSPPKPGGTVLGPGNLSTVSVGTISAGRGTITLAPTAAAIGSVDLVANLGSTGSPSNCAGLSNGSATSAGLAYLSGQWCGAANDRDPTARASFGVFKSPLIYRRENY